MGLQASLYTALNEAQGVYEEEEKDGESREIQENPSTMRRRPGASSSNRTCLSVPPRPATRDLNAIKPLSSLPDPY